MKFLTIVVPILLFSCCSDGISINGEYLGNVSRLKKETWCNWDTNIVIEAIRYEYYDNGLLKHVSKGIDQYYWEQELFYNSNKNMSKEIIYEGVYSVDTVNYKYNSQNLLILKETIHTTSYLSYRNTIEYKYNDSDRLIETIDKRGNQSTIYKSLYEYNGDLLVKRFDYADDLLIRTFEYKYDNRIKVKETIIKNGNTEYTYIYNYENGLLINVEGYFSDLSNIDSEERFTYNSENQLIVKRVKVSMFSSYIDHVIYYEYY